ncbi:unnamed protein product [Macrosiphum euphorbiae]|uniref:Uncharacterized protein n=1 Tax=Macrosiphum euphorbiae TaxID=13131 RepID=A0AAV0VJG3_9HEMI|nr:unnamed protein product [Macrosiphum euphorbiae]
MSAACHKFMENDVTCAGPRKAAGRQQWLCKSMSPGRLQDAEREMAPGQGARLLRLHQTRNVLLGHRGHKYLPPGPSSHPE